MRPRATLRWIAIAALGLGVRSTATADPGKSATAARGGSTGATVAGAARGATGAAAAATGDAARKATAPDAAAGRDADRAGDPVAELGASHVPRIPVVGPTIGAALSAAYAAAGLDRDPGTSWIRRARLGGLVPWITVRTTRDTSWQDGQSEAGHGATLELRATWRLDRLVFDGHELEVSTIEAARRRERRRVGARVIRAYFSWRGGAGAVVGPFDERAATRVAEATAELDALTDGWFSEELLRAQRGDPSPHNRQGTAQSPTELAPVAPRRQAGPT